MHIAGRCFGGCGTEQWVSDFTWCGAECSAVDTSVIVAGGRDIGSVTDSASRYSARRYSAGRYSAGGTACLGSLSRDWRQLASRRSSHAA